MVATPRYPGGPPALVGDEWRGTSCESVRDIMSAFASAHIPCQAAGILVERTGIPPKIRDGFLIPFRWDTAV